MRAALIALIVAAAFPAAAGAALVPIVPPSNSGADQYVENVPTAGGNRPTQSIPRHPRPGRRGVLPAATGTALARQGSDGQTVAAFTQATAPGSGSSSHRHSHAGAPAGGGSGGSGGTGASVGAGASGGSSGSGPVHAVVASLTGSGTGGGLSGGVLLACLIVAAIAVAGVAAWRRRSTT